MGAEQDAVDAVVTQLGKAKDEIISKIADLEAQVAAGETPDLSALKAAAQALDDVVPDAVEEAPVEEAPAEEPAPVEEAPAEEPAPEAPAAALRPEGALIPGSPVQYFIPGSPVQ